MRNITFCILIVLFVSACESSNPTSQQISPTVISSPTKLIIPTAPSSYQIPIVIVVFPSLNVRNGPGRNFDVIGFANQGEEFYALGEYYFNNEQWLAIPIGDNLFGWINGESKYVTQQITVVDLKTYDAYLNSIESARDIYEPLGVASGFYQSSSPVTGLPTSTNFPAGPTSMMIIECKDTKDKVGQFVTCKIQKAYCEFLPDVNGDPTFCNDAPYPNNNFTLTVFGQDWSDYDGKCIVISGTISSYQGKPQILTKNRARISDCE